MDLLIFDLDGTLVDSREDIVASVNWTIAELGGQPLPRETISAEVGRGVKPLLRRSVPLHHHAKAWHLFGQHYSANLAVASKAFGGVSEMLEALKALPKVVLTNKERRFALPLLRALELDHHFRKIYTREDFAPKPDPEGILSAAAEAGARLTQTLMIGDMPLDLEAGFKAGTQTCAVLYGYGLNLESLSPTHAISAANELVCILRNI